MWKVIAILGFSVLVLGNTAHGYITSNAIVQSLITSGNNPTDVTSYGFGVVNPILTLQTPNGNTDYEIGTVSPNWIGGNLSDPTKAGMGIVSGSPKYSTPQIATLGIESWSDLGILFNANEPGDKALQMNELTLNVYAGTGAHDLLAAYSLEVKNLPYTNVAQGQGPAGFILTLDTGALGGLVFSQSYSLGMFADLGCAAGDRHDCGAALAAGDGPDSFTVVSFANPVPEPSTLLLLGSGLVGLGGMAWRKHRR